MRPPDLPADELARLIALRALNLLDTLPEARFDRLTLLAQQLFAAPIALVSLVDADRQWFKSRQGLDAAETPRDISFCGHAILSDAAFVVPNALEDARFADNPLVTGAPNIRFYAGRPLKTANGERIGTLCIIDRKPRSLSESDLAALHALADLAEREICLADFESMRRLLDSTTQQWAHTQEALRRAQTWNQAIIDNANYSIIATDPEGVITTFNRAAERMLGYSAAEVVGRYTPEIIHDATEVHAHAAQLSLELGWPVAPGFGTFVAKPLALGVADESEWTYIRKDGTRLPVFLSVSAFREDSGEVTGYLGIACDITERVAARAALKQFKSTLDRIHDCVFMFNPESLRFFYVNQSAVEQVGYAANELLEMRPCDIQPPFTEDAYRAFIAPLLTGERDAITVETLHRHRDGRDVPVEAFIQYVAPTGEAPRFVCVARDLSERQKVDNMKREFVATVSHELRTPLTAIRGTLGLLLGGVAGELPEVATALLRIADQNTDRLLLLINDILDIEKIESGQIALASRVQALMPLVEDALESNRHFADQFRVSYRLVAAATDVQVSVDANRLQQALTNLLSNAAKFSPTGETVEVDVRARGDHVRIAVRDHGPGVPEAFRARIFQRFAQADSSDTRLKGGTGLGLAISKSLIERMGGHIGFQSEPGQGATFYIDLPRIRAEISHPPTRQPG